MSKFITHGDTYHYLPQLHDYSDLDLSVFFRNLINRRRAVGNHTFVLCTPDVGSIFQITTQHYYCSSGSSHTDSFCAMLNDWCKKYEDGYLFTFFSERIDYFDRVCVHVLDLGAVDPKEELIEVLKI